MSRKNPRYYYVMRLESPSDKSERSGKQHLDWFIYDRVLSPDQPVAKVEYAVLAGRIVDLLNAAEWT